MNVRARWPRRGLYLLTPDEPDTNRLLLRTRPLLAAGIAALQYRNKNASAGLRHEQAQHLLHLCQEYKTPLIINDDWQLAAKINADGAHLGLDDGELKAARAALGDTAILGVSCYDDIHRAERAVAEGADYLAFGSFFASGTKPLARRASLSLLNDSARLNITKVAIGGITPSNAESVISAGADLIAVIGAVFEAPDPIAATHAFLSVFNRLDLNRLNHLNRSDFNQSAYNHPNANSVFNGPL